MKPVITATHRSTRSLAGLFLVSILTTSAMASTVGGNTSGGGGPDTVSAGAIRLLIEGPGLKRALQNYVRTVEVKNVDDSEARKILSRVLVNDLLKKDIEASPYRVATADQPCHDAFDHQTPASALIASPGTDICFDIHRLVIAYRAYSSEEVMIHLASLALHEHIHHFQTTKTSIALNEAEANRVAGYLLVSAKFIQIPVLAWTPREVNEEFSEISAMYEAIRAKEARFLRPKETDYAQYPNFRDQMDRGLFRLLPREKYDGRLSIRGGGSYFSFVNQKTDYGFGSDLALEHGALTTGFAGCDFGFLTKLGAVDLEHIDENSTGLRFLRDFQPASHDEPAIRRQQRESYNVLENEGFRYSRRVDQLHVGETYAVRSINFDESDILVAFRIVRAEKDGSYIIAWKRLRNFPVPSCR